MGSNNTVLRFALGPLIRKLADNNSATFEFLEGGFISPPGPGMTSLLAYDNSMLQGPWYSYFDAETRHTPNEKTIEPALESLSAAIKSDGPFDGILGYSEGALVAAHALMEYARTTSLGDPLPFKCAVFIAGLIPYKFSKVDGQDVIGREEEPLNLGRVLTVHVIGNKDELGEAEKLLELCKGGPTVVVKHEGGHSVPHKPREVENIAEAIERAGKWIQFGVEVVR